MKKKSDYTFKGFELSPQGSLLDQKVDLEGDMGIAYERSHGYYKDFHEHDRLIIVAPRGSCIMDVRFQNPEKAYRIDQKHILVIPKGALHDDEGVSQIYDTFALLPTDNLIMEVLEREKNSLAAINHFINSQLLLQRSDWLNRLLLEYFFERIINKRLSLHAIRFFEEHLILELFRIYSGQEEKSNVIDPEIKTDTLNSGLDQITEKALRHIESNLFDELDVESIASQIGASPSTLRRRFRETVKKGPQEYIRERRLEEAAKLLGNRDMSISDISGLVGYQNFGSFSEAFKKQYKISPSDFRKAKLK